MYLYELAQELGAEPRELIERAAAEEMGHFLPNTELSQEQLLDLRESYFRSASGGRGSLFSGGAKPHPPAGHPDEVGAGSPEPDPYGSPLLRPIYDPAERAGDLGGPLAFDPSTSGSMGGIGALPRGDPAPPVEPPAARWDEPTPWDPLPTGPPLGGPSLGGPSLGGSPRGAAAGPPPSALVDYSKGSGHGSVDADHERQFRYDDRETPKAEPSSSSRSIVIGVLGVILILVVTMAMARRLGIIGPGSERYCSITESPDEEGEGVIEEVVCVDGYGTELSRVVRRPGAGSSGIDFGVTGDGTSTRVVEMDDFCRGANAFLEFHRGFQAQVASATSMVELGRWYDEHDGFGIAGQRTMVGSFGRAGPNPRVVDLSEYLELVRESARSRTVEQAQMFFAAADQAYGDNALEVESFARRNC